MKPKRKYGRVAVVAAVALCAATLTGSPIAGASPSPGRPAAAPLTNLSHLDFLTATVTPPDQADHTTFDMTQQPGIGVLWV